jgi:S-DNA-T family DNA segregation ATPase FtsK/SpoIIIE
MKVLSDHQVSLKWIPIALGKQFQMKLCCRSCQNAPFINGWSNRSGKSVGLNAVLTSLLYTRNPPEEFVLVDPKKGRTDTF